MSEEDVKRNMRTFSLDQGMMSDPNEDPYEIPYHAKDVDLHRTVLLLQEELRMLHEDHEILEEEHKQLEIDNICLQQQRETLQTRLDELVQSNPSSHINQEQTLDETPMKQQSFTSRLFQRKK